MNPSKTSIGELPRPQERPGIYNLRRWDFSDNDTGQAADFVGYFDELFKALEIDRGESLASYAVARLQSVICQPSNWNLLQDFLLQVLVAEPSCARNVIEHFALQQSRGLQADKDAFAAATEALVTRHAQMAHGSEVAWAIWGCISLAVRVTQRAADAAVRMDDNFVALLMLHAPELGLTPQTIDLTHWQGSMSTDQLRGENWLLAYEASIQGWLASPGGADHIQQDAFFDALRAAGVSFYHKPASALPSQSQVITGGGLWRSVP